MSADDQLRLKLREDRLMADLERLSAFREEGQPGWTRRAFTPAYVAARAWLRGRMDEAGLRTEVDAAGNLIGRRPGRHDDLDPIVIGSHIDTVAGGGRFDGTVGMLAGVEIARCLGEAGIHLEHPLEVIDFLAAEPSAWGEWNLGVEALVRGWLRSEVLDRRLPGGPSLAEAMTAVGGRPEALGDGWRRPGSVAAYLELHVEQGPVLDAEGVHLGIVTELPEAWDVRITLALRSNTTRSTPEEVRELLLGAAAEVEATTREIWHSDDNWVVTIERATALDGASSPRVEMAVAMTYVGAHAPVRWPLQMVTFRDRLKEISERRDLEVTEVAMLALERATAPRLQQIMAETARDLGVQTRLLPSPAPHAANWMGWIAPVGMLLIPSRGGRSHRPDEWTEPADVALGAQVLGKVLLRVDARVASGERLRDFTEWTLVDRDGEPLGTLVVVATDQPWIICNFEARPAFEAIRPLFDEEFHVMNDDAKGDEEARSARWEVAYDKIEALGLRLVSDERNEQYTDLLLHINGRRAQLRGALHRPLHDQHSADR